MKNRKSAVAGVYRLGLPLLFSVYILLSLITLSVLSLITSRQSLRNEKLQKESRQAYVVAENQAEEKLRDLNQDAGAGKEEAKVTFSIPVSPKEKLEVMAVRPDGGSSYEIREWKTISYEETGEDTVKGMPWGKEK